jgi:Family of unknown function (DUF6445)
MSTPFKQCDNFTVDAASVRKAVVTGQFMTKKGPDGADYTGISAYPVPHWFKRISAVVGRPIVPKLSCFRLNLAGELPHSWVHSDDICAKYASVLYLNTPEQCQGGTAFWEHKTLHLDRLPSRTDLIAKNIQPDPFYEAMNSDWKNLSLWKQVNFVPMQWNRFITYPTYLFHSRFPFEGFGKGPEDGRLIWICFYDVEARA